MPLVAKWRRACTVCSFTSDARSLVCHAHFTIRLSETAPAPLELRPRWGINLFWRTFSSGAAVVRLHGGVAANLSHPGDRTRAVQSAQQLATVVNLTPHGAALFRLHRTCPVRSYAAREEKVRITPHEPKDTFEPFISDEFGERIAQEIKARLGQGNRGGRQSQRSGKVYGLVL